MKKIIYFALILCIIMIYSKLNAQSFMTGQLYLQVDKADFIPKIRITANDTTVEIDDEALRHIFNDNHVYSFQRAFPIADYFNVPDKFGVDKIYRIKCNCNEDSLLEDLIASSEGIYKNVEKIPKPELLYTPDDYSLSGPDSALNFINATDAWEYTKGDTSIKIGIVDGKMVLPTHEDITGQIVYWDTAGGTPEDFHGLFVAGCAAASTDNGKGKSAIGFKSKIMFSSHWCCDTAGVNSMLKLTYLGAKVVNASWGQASPSPNEQNVINLITANGTLVVAGAGNLPVNGKYGYYFYPASYANVLSVTSIDFDYGFLTWGAGGLWHFNYSDSVDICAPGYHVLGLWDSCESCYKTSSGTSFASPIVAGTAALIFSLNPCLTPAQVTHIIKTTANDTIYTIPENQPYLDSLGTGSLDAGAAVKFAFENYCPMDYIIQNGQTVIWETDKYVKNSINIESGGTLIISGNVYFNKDAVVNVHMGGRLIIDGGHLTTNCRCTLWKGINVWGNRHLGQFSNNQGKLELMNGAVIENALYAVRTVKPIPDREFETASYELEYTGGIVYADSAIFRNNVKAVWFLPYENLRPDGQTIVPNVSYFRKCRFETTERLNDTTKVPISFVELNGVRGIHFYGCSFLNTRTGNYDRESTGNGIYSINSSFLVTEQCLDENCEHMVGSKFSNLNYGIKALGTSPSKPAYVSYTLFDKNYSGIYLKNMDFSTVIRDTFEVKPADTSLNDNISGLYLDQCTGYQVEENEFHSDYLPGGLIQPGQRLGLVVNNSGTEYNKIYNNRFEGLNIGILAENRNRNSTGSNGLELKCNDFIYPNQYDIAVTEETGASSMGIKNPQGTNGTRHGDPAGNTFSYTWNSTGLLYSDFYNECENLVYWYHYNNGGANVNPLHHSPSPKVNPQFNLLNTTTYAKNLSCPSSFSSGGGTSVMDLIANKNEAQGNIDSISGLLAMLVDGGDTPGTNDDVQSSTPEETLELRSDLLSKTPYLSDSVMLSAAAKEDVLPPAIITEILSANPQAAKSDDVMQTLDNRTSPLTDDQLAEIDQGLFVIGAKESLETKLSGFRSEYYEVLKKILIYYKNDSLNSAAGDSVIWYLNGENTLWAKYMLAFEYFVKGDTMSAENTLNNVTTTFSLSSSDLLEHSQYLTYFEILKQLRREGKSIGEADSVHIQMLISLMNNSQGPVSGFASNVLLSRGVINYNEPYILPEEGYKFSKIRHRNLNEKQETSLLKVYPNPARDYIIIVYTLGREPENASILLYDVNGKTILSQSLNTTRDFLVVPLTGITSGNYLCSLRMENKPVQNVRFIIIK